MKDILYIKTAEDIRLIDTLSISNKEKELPNQIILTILSAGAGVGTPIFNKEPDEIGTKFILDGKEITSDDFLVVTKTQSEVDYNFFGLLFEDSNEHTLKISLINSNISNFQRITSGSGCSANSITSVVISNSITEIGNSTFEGCTGLTSVTIPNSVTSIGSSAFSSCTGLTSVTIGNSVTSIGGSAFYGCSGLNTVTWNPKNYSDFSSSSYTPFNGLTRITSFVFGNEVEHIPAYLCYGLTGLTSVTIPNSVISIGRNALSGTSWYNNQSDGLVYAGMVAYKYKGTMPDGTSIALIDGCKSVTDEAFYECSGLTSVTIPNSVTSIASSAFYGCNGLTSMVVESENTKYDSRNNCNAIIETVTNTLISGCKNTIIPNSVTKIGEGAFYGCSGLTSVNIPNSVTEIGDKAFRDCSGLTSVNIPNSVTEIGDRAFWGCRGMTTATIGNLVTSIGARAFDGCSGLTSIISLATTAPAIQSNTFINIKTNGTLHVPAGSDYSTWMSTDNYYLGKCNWTKVEDA